MVDADGNLATTTKKIEEIAVDVYKKRLENRPIKEGLENLQRDKERLCMERLKSARKEKTAPWTIDDLEKVLSYLKKNKSRDPLGCANDIFASRSSGERLEVCHLEAHEQNKV